MRTLNTMHLGALLGVALIGAPGCNRSDDYDQARDAHALDRAVSGDLDPLRDAQVESNTLAATDAARRPILRDIQIEFEEMIAEAKALGVNPEREVEAARVEVQEALHDFSVAEDPDDLIALQEELGEAMDHYRKAIAEADTLQRRAMEDRSEERQEAAEDAMGDNPAH